MSVWGVIPGSRARTCDQGASERSGTVPGRIPGKPSAKTGYTAYAAGVVSCIRICTRSVAAKPACDSERTDEY